MDPSSLFTAKLDNFLRLIEHAIKRLDASIDLPVFFLSGALCNSPYNGVEAGAITTTGQYKNFFGFSH
jgi:hypothetical protein